ncbi:MAG: sulfatase [Lentisphaeraceae bacterium]|nr:sulfatase [Lentisphaeraceae bacterium]
MKYAWIFFLILTWGCTSVSADKPNIVMILSDDQAWSDYSFMGHKHIKTPHLDKLATEGVLFRRAYVPTGLCRPSLMTLATGQYVSVHGVTGNDPFGDSKNPNNPDLKASLISKIDKFDTLPELLGEQGYLSHQSGKWWEGNYKRGGFTHGMTRGYPQKGGRHGDDGLKIGREGIQPVADFVDMAIEKDKPFFVWYAPFMPHTPHTPPKRLLKKYLAKGLPKPVASYYAMCEWFDETCGDVVKMLEDKKVRDNTIIVYVCDNGWTQNPTKPNKYALRSKQTAYENGVRTPIFFSWPAKYKQQDRPELFSSIDIFPTLLAAAGARIPKNLPGLNLNEHMIKGSKIDRDHIFGESFAHDILDINDPEKTLLFRWCIKGKWKLLLTYDGTVSRYKTTHPRNEKRPQLFDLSADPGETENLAKDNPEVVAELVKKINNWYPVKTRKVITEFK